MAEESSIPLFAFDAAPLAIPLGLTLTFQLLHADEGRATQGFCLSGAEARHSVRELGKLASLASTPRAASLGPSASASKGTDTCAASSSSVPSRCGELGRAKSSASGLGSIAWTRAYTVTARSSRSRTSSLALPGPRSRKRNPTTRSCRKRHSRSNTEPMPTHVCDSRSARWENRQGGAPENP